MSVRCSLCGEFNPSTRHSAVCRTLKGKQAALAGPLATLVSPSVSAATDPSTGLPEASYGTVYRQYQEAVEAMEDEGGPVREPIVQQAPSDPPPTAETAASFIREVIMQTYPQDVAPRLAEKTCDLTRLRKNLDERAWFVHYGDDWELVGLAAVHMQDEDTAALTTHFVSRRGEGIGRELTERRLAWARSMGAKRVVAHTHPWNTVSLGNLQKRGFVITGESVDSWSGNGGIIYDLEIVL